MYDELRTTVERAWDDRSLLQDDTTKAAIREVVELIDKGLLRTAEPVDLARSQWQVNEWVKKAVILYFPIQKMRILRAGELEWYDKMDIKRDYDRLGVRAVPHAVARYGAYIAPGAILMPSYVNIGAYVGEGTMVDTWATVGSCAQIGSHVHLSGGVGIGGVLEPVQAAPVIIEDNCFVGSRARSWLRGTRLPRGGARLEHGHHRFDAHHRRHGGRTGRIPGLRSAAFGRNSGSLRQEVSGRRVQRGLRAHHRAAQGVDRQEDLAQRRAARFRRCGVKGGMHLFGLAEERTDKFSISP